VPGAGARATVTQVAARIGDSFFSLGPVPVLVLTGHQRFSWVIAPWLVGALLAQLVLDTAVGLARTRFAERVKPSDQPQMLWLYLTDVCLSLTGWPSRLRVPREHVGWHLQWRCSPPWSSG
jgi:hypothetical protein